MWQNHFAKPLSIKGQVKSTRIECPLYRFQTTKCFPVKVNKAYRVGKKKSGRLLTQIFQGRLTHKILSKGLIYYNPHIIAL